MALLTKENQEMEIGTKIKTENGVIIAVYDNTIECDRCDLFDNPYLKCVDENIDCEMENIDCEMDKIVFKIIENKS